MTATQPIIQLENINFAYPGRRPVLEQLDFSLQAKERLGLIAPNGSGKTTLFHLIMGLVKPASGRITLFGETVETEKAFAAIRGRIGLLFQDADDQLFSPTVIEDVAFGPLNLGHTKTEALAIARRTLQMLNLEGFENRVTFQLSGGEKRLVALATVLAMEPEVLLLDEPTTGLDRKTKASLIDILNRLELSFVLISHEIDFLVETTDAIYSMERGRIVTDTGTRVHSHRHAHAHGHTPHEHDKTPG